MFALVLQVDTPMPSSILMATSIICLTLAVGLLWFRNRWLASPAASSDASQSDSIPIHHNIHRAYWGHPLDPALTTLTEGTNGDVLPGDPFLNFLAAAF